MKHIGIIFNLKTYSVATKPNLNLSVSYLGECVSHVLSQVLFNIAQNNGTNWCLIPIWSKKKYNAMIQPKIVFIKNLIKLRIDFLQSSFHQACEVVIK